MMDHGITHRKSHDDHPLLKVSKVEGCTITDMASKTLLASTAIVSFIGAYQLVKRSTVNREKLSDTSEMVSSQRLLSTLLSFSFFSTSTTAFNSSTSPAIHNHNRREGLLKPLCVAKDNSELNEKTEKTKDGESKGIDGGTNALQKETSKVNERQDLPDDSLLESITMQPIGHISSVYRLCVGTPRQGLLAPNSRGRIDLNPNRIASDSVLDLDKFSHVWVVFIFHLNSNAKSVENAKKSKQQFPSKIKPPALGGKRVGIFATRSPHRPNPIGFSLCKIDKVVIPPKKKHQKASNTPYHVYVSGLDLVDGTPVLDIKPYVPHYDSVGYMYEEGLGVEKEARLPKWVSDGLGKRKNVEFTPKADEQLKSIVMENDGEDLEFYGKSTGRDTEDADALESIRSCIVEVLSVDVRSKWQTSKSRKGKSRAETAKRVKEIKKNGAEDINPDTSNICTQQLDRLLIKFVVKEDIYENEECAVDTRGSGADDKIVVLGIEFMPKK